MKCLTHQLRAQLRAATVIMVVVAVCPLLLAGSTRSIWMSVLRGPAEHQCSCSLAPGHHCHCPKCIEESERDDSHDRPLWRDFDCDDDDDGHPKLVAQTKVLLPPSLIVAVSASYQEAVFTALSELLSRQPPPPVPPPPKSFTS